MRRLLALFVVAVIGAAAFGWSGASSGLRVGGSRVAASTVRAELAAISTNPVLDCYLTALAATTFGPGSGGDTLGAAGAAAWTGLRVEGAAIVQFVRVQFHFRVTPSRRAAAESSLEGELTQAAASRQLNCAGPSSLALAEMPAEMRGAQLDAQAASLFLVSQLNSTIPLNAASLHAYYSAHLSAYDTLCVSAAVVLPASVNAFRAAQASGLSVVQLVQKFSVDAASKAKNGALGCYAPGSSVYPTVRTDVGAAALDTFPATAVTVVLNGAPYALYVAATKRTVTPFASASTQVYADAQSLDASAASRVKESILYRAAIAVDPSFGRWGLSSTGPSVFAPATPPSADVTGASVLARSTGATYK
ncbi:MAG: hypothetical protein ACHQFZ_07480 [Acidimicrobiales bacterium]